MPAPATNKLVALTLLLLAACASNPEPSIARPSAAQEAVAPDSYAPPPPVSVSPVETLADLETSLAAYEAQLAQNEARLQAMGVRIARADPAGVRAEADKADDNRFAEPPPPRVGDAPLAGATARPTTKPTRPAPAPTPAQPSRPAEEKSERGKAKKTAGGEAEAPRANTPRSDSGSGRSQGDLPSKTPARDEAKDGDRGRCADLCDLAHATCDLEAKICDLAARHVDEPRYAEVCQRAGDDCRAAAEACTLCSP